MDCYKIVEVGIVKLHATHIPYFGYTIVAGPRGGKYMLDGFNSEILVHEATNDKFRGLYGKVIMARAGFKREQLTSNVNDNTIEDFAKANVCVLLKRGKGMEKAKLIAKKLDPTQKIKLEQTGVEYHNEVLRS